MYRHCYFWFTRLLLSVILQKWLQQNIPANWGMRGKASDIINCRTSWTTHCNQYLLTTDVHSVGKTRSLCNTGQVKYKSIQNIKRRVLRNLFFWESDPIQWQKPQNIWKLGSKSHSRDFVFVCSIKKTKSKVDLPLHLIKLNLAAIGSHVTLGMFLPSQG